MDLFGYFVCDCSISLFFCSMKSPYNLGWLFSSIDFSSYPGEVFQLYTYISQLSTESLCHMLCITYKLSPLLF